MSKMTHCASDLIRLFNHCFAESHNTRLVRGEEEPIYLPASKETPYHAIHFAHGFFSSALHECAHWFIAGEARRQQIDYGYWYQPDGRNEQEQALFERVEVKPQAIEWILSEACGYRFQLSVDNLNGAASRDTGLFREAIYQQMMRYSEQGLPDRAEMFRRVLSVFYQSQIITNNSLLSI